MSTNGEPFFVRVSVAVTLTAFVHQSKRSQLHAKLEWVWAGFDGDLILFRQLFGEVMAAAKTQPSCGSLLLSTNSTTIHSALIGLLRSEIQTHHRRKPQMLCSLKG